MPRNIHLTTELEFTKTQLGVFFTLILLSIDEINPVKILLHVFPSVAPWHIASVCVLLIIYVFLSQMKLLLYYGMKIFFHSILSIFFREVEVIGRENIPGKYGGPVIFTINHANQFMDAVMVVCTCGDHKISYLMAESSWKRKIVGHIAWALDVIPVKRAQDDAKPGTGTITLLQQTKTLVPIADTKTATTTGTTAKEDSTIHKTAQDAGATLSSSSSSPIVETVQQVQVKVTGFGTIFTKELAYGDKIRPPKTALALKVIQVESDTCVILDGTPLTHEEYEHDEGWKAVLQQSSNSSTSAIETEEATPSPSPVRFDILKKVDTKVVFEKVLDKLAANGAIGIFPEGGSHDRTELLPLKAGIALIAYSAMDKYNIAVPIVPVGLNYFRAHRWRGRAVIEYGKPVLLDTHTLKQYQAGGPSRRKVCDELLDRIETAMKSVIVSTPDYETLELIHTARRLYKRTKGPLETAEKQELSRRFAEGYKRLLLLTDGKPPPEWLALQQRIMEYRNELKDLGLKDYQVPGLTEEHLEENALDHVDGDMLLSWLQLPYQICHVLFLLIVAAIPILFLNLPVGILADLYAERKRKKALANSKVKVRGFDVMLTEKVVFCIVMVPALWIFYGLVLEFGTNMDTPTIALLVLSMPVFAYMGIVVAEAGMVSWKDLRPFFMRLSPSARRRLAALPEKRKKLQDDLRAFIKSIGPALGDIYYAKGKLDWKVIMETSQNKYSEDSDHEESKKDK